MATITRYYLADFGPRYTGLNTVGYTLPDGSGENDGITKAEVGAVVFDTANALVTLLNAGHATNMAKLL